MLYVLQRPAGGAATAWRAGFVLLLSLFAADLDGGATFGSRAAGAPRAAPGAAPRPPAGCVVGEATDMRGGRVECRLVSSSSRGRNQHSNVAKIIENGHRLAELGGQRRYALALVASSLPSARAGANATPPAASPRLFPSPQMNRLAPRGVATTRPRTLRLEPSRDPRRRRDPSRGRRRDVAPRRRRDASRGAPEITPAGLHCRRAAAVGSRFLLRGLAVKAADFCRPRRPGGRRGIPEDPRG